VSIAFWEASSQTLADASRLYCFAGFLSRLTGKAHGTETVPWLPSLDVALRQIGDRSLLPVVSHADLHKVEGIVMLDGVLRIYRGRSSDQSAELR